MRTSWRLIVGLMLLLVVTAAASDGQSNRKIAVRDDCDPADPNWAPVGCFHDKGDVTRSEFDLLLFSPLSLSTVGHPSWRNDPSYLTIEPDEEVRVENTGGRPHTFTKVAQYGGGRVPPLNRGLVTAPECVVAPGQVDPTELPPGEQLDVKDLGVGLHRFQCCIHPWMRAAIKVTDEHKPH